MVKKGDEMKVNKLSPNFEVKNIKETVDFYEKNFGFSLVMAVPETQDGVEQKLSPEKEYVYAMMQKDNAEFMFQRSDSFKEDISLAKDLAIGASVSFYMDVEGIDEFHRTLKNNKLDVTDIAVKWYGMKEFYVKDVNDYIIGFGQKA